jgi:HEAT repeat protein
MSNLKGFQVFIKNLGTSTTSDLSKVLEAAQAISDEHMIVATCVMIASLGLERPDPQRYERPLDALSSCKSAIGGDALVHIAQHAQNARIRVEAIRRLGGVGTKPAKELLHQSAKDGFGPSQGFNGEVIQPEAVRRAAFQALGKLVEPGVSDGKRILESLARDLTKGDYSGVFRDGATALAHVVRPNLLKDIIGAATGCRHSLMALTLLAACSELDSKELGPEKEAISEVLTSSMNDFHADGDLLDKLCVLAQRITHKELVLKVSALYSGDNLDTGRGKIASAALEAYRPKDETLTEAYLRYAQAPTNVRQENKCIAGLSACAAAGHAATIAKRIVNLGSPGYQELAQSECLRSVFGDVANVVNVLCEAIDLTENKGQIPNVAQRVCEGFIRVSMSGVASGYMFGRLGEIRTPESRMQREGQLPELAKSLLSIGRDHDAIAELAARLCSSKTGTGAVAIASVLLKPCDLLAGVFLDRLLTAASHLKMNVPPSSVEESPLALLEPLMFPDCREWFARELPGRIVKEGRLNRYAIDLLRRYDLKFVENADKALQQVKVPADAVFILKLLASRVEEKSLRLLGRAIEQGFLAGDDGVDVRRMALELLGNIAGSRPKTLDPALTQDLLNIIHNRVRNEKKIVRICAYDACGQFANPASITSLRERLKSEREESVQKVISSALAAVKKRLVEERPATQAPANVITSWLGHIADLEDKSLAEEALRFLCPPHPEAVLIATLKCLSRIGQRETIAAIDSFVGETCPAREVLKAAHHAKALLQGRKDFSLIDALAFTFEPDSPVVDLSVNYGDIFGAARVSVLASGLARAGNEWQAGQWSYFVTTMDAVCDVLNRHQFETQWARMNLAEGKAKELAKKEYGNRLRVSEYEKTFANLQPMFAAIHSMRGEAEIAHLENQDGTAKGGVGEDQAKLVIEQFKLLFPAFLDALDAKDALVS